MFLLRSIGNNNTADELLAPEASLPRQASENKKGSPLSRRWSIQI